MIGQIKIQKKRKQQQGFTLVEVIVVAVIVAALATVAVPLYTTYVATTKEGVIKNCTGNIVSFLGSAVSLGDTVYDGSTAISVGSSTHKLAGVKTLIARAEADTSSKFVIPSRVTVTINSSAGTVFSHFTDHPSKTSDTLTWK